MTTQVEQKKSPAARVTVVHQRAIFALLEENFNVETLEYAEGWSDLRIAQEVGCTPAAVVYRREGAFGKIKKLPTKLTLADLRDAVDIVCERLSWIEGDCQKNFEQMHVIIQALGSRAEHTDGVLAGHGERLDKLDQESLAVHKVTANINGRVVAQTQKITDLGGTQKVMTDTMGVITDEIALPGENTIGQIVSILMEEMGELQGKVTKLLNADVVAEVDDG